MAKVTAREAEAIRIKVAREAVRQGTPLPAPYGSVRKAWARFFGLPEDEPAENIIVAMDGLIAALERGS